jgi:hypothetical protein
MTSIPHASSSSVPSADETARTTVVETFTGRRGTVVRVSPPDTPPELRRVFVRLWLQIGNAHGRPPARVIVAYHPRDVKMVRP